MNALRNVLNWRAAGAAALVIAATTVPAAGRAMERHASEDSNRDKTGTTRSPETPNGPQTLVLPMFASRQVLTAEGMGPCWGRAAIQVSTTTCSAKRLPVANLRLFACGRASSRALGIDHGD